MRLSQLAFAVLAALALAVPPAQADFYKWTDERGQIHLSDDYYKVPPKYRSQVEVKKIEERDSGVGTPPPLGSETQQTPTERSWNEPTAPTGGPEAAGWQDISGHGAEYWTDRKQNLRAKAEELERRLEVNKEMVEKLSSTRAAYVGGRRHRARMQAENEQLAVELGEVRRMLRSGLAEEALRAGVPPEFANSLRDI